MDIARLTTLVTAAELGSLTAAARKLRARLSTVSRHVKQLEAETGQELFLRTGRGVRLTPAGERFVERARLALRELDAAFAEARGERGAETRPLRITAPVELALSLLPACLAEVHTAHPDAILDVHSEARRVSLLEEDVDAALRLGRLADSELLARPLGAVSLVLCGSPRLAARRLRAREVATLVRVGVAGVPAPATTTSRGTSLRLVGPERIRVSTFREAADVAAATELGVLLPSYTAHGQLASGALVRILPGLVFPRIPVHMLVPRHHRASPVLATLAASVRAHLARKG